MTAEPLSRPTPFLLSFDPLPHADDDLSMIVHTWSGAWDLPSVEPRSIELAAYLQLGT